MNDNSLPMADSYFSMNDEGTFEKKKDAPFCSEPLELERNEEGKLEKFYFVAPAQVQKAFIEAENEKGEKFTFKTEEEFVQALKEEKNVKKKYFIAGGVSDNTKDLDGEKMSVDCIKSMQDSGKRSDIPLRNAHNKEWDSDLGKMVDISIDQDKNHTLMCKFELNDFEEDPLAKKLWTSVQKGKKIGFSIGGIVKNYHTEFDDELEKEMMVYDAIELKEVSVTGHPANPNTFVHAISKALKHLEKKPLNSARRNNLKDSDFAYVKDGVRKFPIHDANHVRNAMARFNQADISAEDKPKVWRKILAAARKFGIKVNPKGDKSIDTDKRYDAVKMYLDLIVETPEVIKDWDDVGEDEREEGMSYRDFNMLVSIFSMLSQIEYPNIDENPKDLTWEVINGLPPECFVILDGMRKVAPHHNPDYTVNPNWLEWQVKQLMDGNMYLDMDEYYTVLSHLFYHLKEFNMTKTTDAEQAKLLNKSEDAPQVDATPPAPETPTPEPAPVEEAKPAVEQKEEATEETPKEESQPQDTPAPAVEEPKAAEESEKSYSAKEVAALVETIKNLNSQMETLNGRLNEIENTPVYKTSVPTKTVISTEKTLSAEELSEYTGLTFKSHENFTEDEAIKEVESLAPYRGYEYKQSIRHLFKYSK